MRVLDQYPWVRQCFCGVSEDRSGLYCDAECPIGAHTQARLRFWLGTDNRLMFGCYRECPKLEILRAVGASWRDCFPDGNMPERPKQEIAAKYPYCDVNGKVVFQTIRLEPGYYGRDKDFKQRRPHPSGSGWINNLDGVQRILYRLPELMAADPDVPVCVLSGEKDVETMRVIGFVATTNVCGEKAEWLDSYSDALKGRHVVVIPDGDATGKRHANEVLGNLLGTARSVRRVVLPAPLKDPTALVTHLRFNGVTDPHELRKHVAQVIGEFHRWEECK